MASEESKEAGAKAMRESNWGAARDVYEAAAQAEPNDGVHWSNLSAATVQMGCFRAAMVAGENAVRAKPDWPKAKARAALAATFGGQWERAVEWAQQALASDASNESAKRSLSLAKSLFEEGMEETVIEIENQVNQSKLPPPIDAPSAIANGESAAVELLESFFVPVTPDASDAKPFPLDSVCQLARKEGEETSLPTLLVDLCLDILKGPFHTERAATAFSDEESARALASANPADLQLRALRRLGDLARNDELANALLRTRLPDCAIGALNGTSRLALSLASKGDIPAAVAWNARLAACARFLGNLVRVEGGSVSLLHRGILEGLVLATRCGVAGCSLGSARASAEDLLSTCLSALANLATMSERVCFCLLGTPNLLPLVMDGLTRVRKAVLSSHVANALVSESTIPVLLSHGIGRVVGQCLSSYISLALSSSSSSSSSPSSSSSFSPSLFSLRAPLALLHALSSHATACLSLASDPLVISSLVGLGKLPFGLWPVSLEGDPLPDRSGPTSERPEDPFVALEVLWNLSNKAARLTFQGMDASKVLEFVLSNTKQSKEKEEKEKEKEESGKEKKDEDEKKEKESKDVLLEKLCQSALIRVLSSLSLDRQNALDMWPLRHSLLSLASLGHPGLQASSFVILANLASDDEKASLILQLVHENHSFLSLVERVLLLSSSSPPKAELLTSSAMALSCLRNCLVPPLNKRLVGSIPSLISSIVSNCRVKQAHSQMESILVLHSLLFEPSNVLILSTPQIVSLVLDVCSEPGFETHRLEEENSDSSKSSSSSSSLKDRRVQYESSRLLVDFLSLGPSFIPPLVLSSSFGVSSLVELLTSSHSVLQRDGLRGLLVLARQGGKEQVREKGGEVLEKMGGGVGWSELMEILKE